ncbi:MAG: hypothetical protein K9L21_01365 [Spirochaetia bacterium]|jgi:adenylate kinase family enzyme/uncharacterized alkaline shock family protein YloU|nr:hypothetical protein [Spirochaetia bacterium]
MNRFLRFTIWKLRGKKVYALIGRSGTGKSFRSKLVAEKYGIELIIDDGLLIRGDKIVSGKSAKKEKVFLKAIKTALFDEELHRNEMISALQKEDFKRILIIGTSERMVQKIASRLKLPEPEKVFKIEDFASKEEIDTAIHIRNSEGKHVIPVPTIEITRNYPQIVYDSLRIFLKRKLSVPWNKKVFEKTIVRPEFGKRGKITMSEAALTQMVIHCLDEFDDSISVKKVVVKNEPEGYNLNVKLKMPIKLQVSGTLVELQRYIADSLERYGGVIVAEINLEIDDWTSS